MERSVPPWAHRHRPGRRANGARGRRPARRPCRRRRRSLPATRHRNDFQSPHIVRLPAPLRGSPMPIASPEQYSAMIDNAKQQGFAFPAINVTSSQTLNAALQGFADAESDGIIQVSLGTALYLSGARVQNRATGSKALAQYAHEVAKDYGVTIALHTDHCAVEYLDDWVRPLLADSIERRSRGLDPLFQSHMWDGSAVPLGENLRIAEELLDLST